MRAFLLFPNLSCHTCFCNFYLYHTDTNDISTAQKWYCASAKNVLFYKPVIYTIISQMPDWKGIRPEIFSKGNPRSLVSHVDILRETGGMKET